MSNTIKSSITTPNPGPADGPGSTEPARYVDAVVLYADIVGFTALVERTGDDPVPPREALRALSVLHPEEQRQAMAEVQRYVVQLADSLLLVALYGQANGRNLRSALLAAWIQADRWQDALLSSGLVLRGGLTSGKVCIDRREGPPLIFGPGVNRAVELERRVAVFPRIVVESNIIPEDWKRDSRVIRFSDDVWFLNALGVDPMLMLPPLPRFGNIELHISRLKKHREMVSALAERARTQSHLARVCWLAMYHNLCVGQLLLRLGARLDGNEQAPAWRKAVEECRIDDSELAQSLVHTQPPPASVLGVAPPPA